MRIAEHRRDQLVVTAGDAAFARLLLLAAVACLGLAVFLYATQPHALGSGGFRGAVFGSVVFLTGFVAIFEQARFVFDGRARRLAWSRRRAYGSDAGTVPFDDIRDIVFRALSDGVPNPKWRVEIRLGQGTLPLSVAFVPDPGGESRALAETLQSFVRAHGRG
jgi:hypothetical protein